MGAVEVRKPARKSSESPGRKKPKNRPDSAKMIAVMTQTALLPAFSSQNSGFRNDGPTARIWASIRAPYWAVSDAPMPLQERTGAPMEQSSNHASLQPPRVP